MSSVKGLLLGAIGRFALEEATVREIVEAGPTLRIATIEGASLRTRRWTPGDKVQVLLPSRDVRTYTPSRWTTATGVAELVVYIHGDAPGARWGRALQVGERMRFVGPQSSLKRDPRRAAILFGDETSLGLARAFALAAPDRPLACVFEVTAPEVVETALPKLELPTTTRIQLVARARSDVHLESVTAALRGQLETDPDAELIFSGRAQSIQAVRAQLKASGVDRRGASKPYWSVGKTGLD